MSGLTPNAQNRMDKRILIDATNVNIMQPGGGSYCTQAYIEAFLALYPGRIDVMHPQEAHIRDERYTTLEVPSRPLLQAALGCVTGHLHRGANFLIHYIQLHPDTYDTVLISTGLYAGGIIEQLHRMHIRVIVLHHNFEPEYRMDSRSILTLRGMTDRFVRYWEKKGYLQADVNLFLTQQDKQRFEEEYGTRPDNHVSGVFEPTYQRQAIDSVPPTDSAVITCALGDIQNQAPLLRFADTYMPVFRELLPGWHIELMGRNPSQTICFMAEKNPYIHLTANPKDLRELASRSKIYLCPMDAGGGLKLRIMDGLRAGQVVLVHERSARGYDQLVNEPFFFVYNDEETFRTQLLKVVQYVQSKTYSRQIVQDRYYQLFGMQAGIQRLEKIMS